MLGALGPVGPGGPEGFPGDKGPLGQKGERGHVGLTGPSGLKGDKGPLGVPGFPGTDGVPGYPGQDGGRGLPGADGCNGTQGDPGPRALDRGTPGASGLPTPDLKVLLRLRLSKYGHRTDLRVLDRSRHLTSDLRGSPGLVFQGEPGDKGNTGPPGPRGVPVDVALEGSSIVTIYKGEKVTQTGAVGVREREEETEARGGERGQEAGPRHRTPQEGKGVTKVLLAILARRERMEFWGIQGDGDSQAVQGSPGNQATEDLSQWSLLVFDIFDESPSFQALNPPPPSLSLFSPLLPLCPCKPVYQSASLLVYQYQ
ncbi:unnamed protein product [Coregonus sp. 'balchen']|nr:unnamed protein product [Coregonus sp. 'balchen']